MANRIVLFVIDGFGIGSMPDAHESQNTWLSVKNSIFNKGQLSFLEKLLKNEKTRKLSLDYPGADSFLGHLTMSGINCSKLSIDPLIKNKNAIISKLVNLGYYVQEYNNLIIVNDSVVISDNFEAEHGLAINVNGLLDLISWDEQQKIALIVRQIVNNSRVISFSAKNINIKNYLDNIQYFGEYVGIDTPKTGVYNDTFVVNHLPINFDVNQSIQNNAKILGYEVKMFGKFGDIIKIENTYSNTTSNTKEILDDFLEKFLSSKTKELFCVNIQETDLAGHKNNIEEYVKILSMVSSFLEKFVTYLKSDDMLIVTSDHGNDPCSGNKMHSREFVPLIIIPTAKYKCNNLSEISKIIEDNLDK